MLLEFLKEVTSFLPLPALTGWVFDEVSLTGRKKRYFVHSTISYESSPRRSLPCASLPLASFEAPLSCLRPHPKHQGLRRSGRAAHSPSRYNRWAAHRSR